MTTLMFTSDWHIRRNDRVWSRRPEIIGDVTFGLQELLRVIDEHSVSAVFAAGDLFHEKLHSATSISAAVEFLDGVNNRGCDLYYVQGQHEMSDPPILSTLRSYAKHIDKSVVDISCMSIYGLDYQHPQVVEQSLKRVPKCDILVTHQVWKDLMGDFGVVSASLLDCRVPLVFSGDFHQHLVRGLSNTTIYSPGPLARQKIDENTDKAVFLLDTDTGDVISVPLRERSCYVYRATRGSEDVTSEDRIEQISGIVAADLDKYWEGEQPNELPECIRTPIVRISLSSELVSYHDYLLDMFSGRCHMFLDVFEQSESIGVSEVSLPASDTVSIEDLVRSQFEAGIADDVLSLLSAGDGLGDTIEQIFDKEVERIMSSTLANNSEQSA